MTMVDPELAYVNLYKLGAGQLENSFSFASDALSEQRAPTDVTLTLSRTEALVLLEWLVGRSDPEPHMGSAELAVLWRLEALLEPVLPELLDPQYLELLSEARRRVASGA